MKEDLERIWQDKRCRSPVHRIRWLREYDPKAAQEGPGLFYMRGEMAGGKEWQTEKQRRRLESRR